MDFVKLSMSNFQFSILNHIIANFVHTVSGLKDGLCSHNASFRNHITTSRKAMEE
jgi:hypothetical protein